MWIKARDLEAKELWINVARARSIRRVAEEHAGGPTARTIIALDDGEFEVLDTPEQIFAAMQSKS